MNFRYYLKYLGGVYVWLLGGFVVLCIVVGALFLSGVQANYKEFLSFWAILLAICPFFVSRYNFGPDPAQLFPNYPAARATVFTLLLQICTTIPVAFILLWAINEFHV